MERRGHSRTSPGLPLGHWPQRVPCTAFLCPSVCLSSICLSSKLAGSNMVYRQALSPSSSLCR